MFGGRFAATLAQEWQPLGDRPAVRSGLDGRAHARDGWPGSYPKAAPEGEGGTRGDRLLRLHSGRVEAEVQSDAQLGTAL